jgi:hypothetical protein
MQTTDSHTVAAGVGAQHPSRSDDARPHGAPAATSPTPYTCKQGKRCPVYQAIRVEAADVHGVHRITFHGTYVGTSAPFNAAVTVLGLHAGAHLEAQQWRWAAPEGMEP